MELPCGLTGGSRPYGEALYPALKSVCPDDVVRRGKIGLPDLTVDHTSPLSLQSVGL